MRSVFEIADDMYNNMHELVAMQQKVVEKEMRVFNSSVGQEFGEYQRDRIREIFTRAVDTFYSAYDPIEYIRKNGLYELLRDHLPTDENGIISLSGNLIDMFDESKMHANRSGGNSLFQTVFVEGWHGGAKSIGPNSLIIDPHPSPGTAYYRTWGMPLYRDTGQRVRWHRYGAWGDRAVRTTSPYTIFVNEIHSIAGREMFSEFKRISAKQNEEMIRRINAQMPEINKQFASKYYY